MGTGRGPMLEIVQWLRMETSRGKTLRTLTGRRAQAHLLEQRIEGYQLFSYSSESLVICLCTK